MWEGQVRATHIKKLNRGRDQKGTSQKDWVEITITQGKNRQVHRMFEKVNLDVEKLKRVAIGGLKLGPLKPGTYRPLREKDLEQLFRS